MIDSHVHILAPQLNYPWLDEVPALKRSSSSADHRAQAELVGILGCVLVEADVDPLHIDAEARLMCTRAEDPLNKVVGVVAAARPENDGFADQLKRIVHPHLRGIRRVLHVVSNEISRAPQFRRNVARLSDYGLSFDICMRADQLPLAIELVQAAPRTRFVLDHGGNPPLATPAALPAWRNNVASLGQQGNVVCKLSGLVNHLPPGAHAAATLQPIVNHLWSCFGWQRLLFGSDWPVCNLAGMNVPNWLNLAKDLVAHLNPESAHAVFTTNALRVYGPQHNV